MEEFAEKIQESVEQASRNSINSRVALFVAITATFMALCNVKDKNIVRTMSEAQASVIDTWSYYEAKSTKQSITEKSLELLKIENLPQSEAVIKTYQEQIARYEKEKNEISAQAKGYQKQYEDLELLDDQFDMTDAMLTIAIAMLGITSLTQKKWLLYFASAFSLFGILLGLASFLKISLHSDLISKILG
jgi:hypothetical protein